MTRPLHAVVLHGASADRPDEADTVVQAGEILDALQRLGWEAEIRVLGGIADLPDLLTPPPSLVFNLVEAIGGNGRLASLAPRALDRLGIRYTGSSARAQLTTTHKPLSKRRMRAAGLPTPDWVALGATPDGTGRYIVKSASEDASLGIDAASVVPATAVAGEIAARTARFGGRWFAEAYVDGREFNVGLLDGPDGLDVLPIAEIQFLDFPPDRPRIVDYEAKWLSDSFAYNHTPRRFLAEGEDASLRTALSDLARQTFRLFGLSGYGRVDFRVDAAGQPWILEANANPCLSQDAGFMAAAAQAGLVPSEVIGRIVRATGIVGPDIPWDEGEGRHAANP
ncbi:MAG: D-alanine--D-alanine ligase [Alphaproteobacteria bacterium]